MNLRQRKKVRTRVALGDAAVRLFLDRGFDQTTIEDIVAEAGVSRRTFFRYVPSKEAAFFAFHAERIEDFVARVDALAPSLGAWGAMNEALLEVERSFDVDREGALAWRRVMRGAASLVANDLRMDADWERRIAQAFRGGGFPPFEAAARAGAVMGVVRAVLVHWF